MAVRGIGTLYLDGEPIGIATDFNLNINETFGSMRSKMFHLDPRKSIDQQSTGDIKLFDEVLTKRKLLKLTKKESKMSKRKNKKSKSRKHFIKMLESTITEERTLAEVQRNEIALLKSQVVNRDGNIINLKEQRYHQQREIEQFQRVAENNLENFKLLNEKYQKAIDFIGSITHDIKANIDFTS